jgi:alginate O-acetyltransferase complex protein AlgJ
LRAGNEQVYTGRGGWLFYRADVDHVTGPPFLDPFRLKRRAQTSGVQSDPINAIINFRDQLAARRIPLVVLPIPVKPTIEAEDFSASAEANRPLQNASFSEFLARLEDVGIPVFDPTRLLMERKKSQSDQSLYLESDTHWRPETMEIVARELANFLKRPGGTRAVVSQLLSADSAGGIFNALVTEKEVVGRGDVAAMLKMSKANEVYPPEKITIHQVTIGNNLWRPDKNAGVLLLGDSFANVFSLEGMGWGESAGFAEHLSLALHQPIDCILRNSDGAFATREILSNELARGHDRLAGKKLVIWEFAARELSFGDWKQIDLTVGAAKPSHFFNLKPGEEIVVTGTIESVSSVPRPGTVPYKDHIFAVHLIDIRGPASAKSEELQAVVYLWSMRDNAWTAAARLRPGDRVNLRLQSWSDVSAQYEKFNRTELDDAALQLEEPLWGELQ